MNWCAARRHSRRAFLKLVMAASLLAGQTACQPGSLPGVVPGRGGQQVPQRETRAALPDAPSAPGPVVAIVRGDDPDGMVRGAVALAGGLEGVVRPGSTVLLKPNLTIPSASGLGNVTDSRVLLATIELCQEAGAARVLVGDGAGGGDTEQIMRQAGYEPVLAATGAEFVDLNRDDVVMRRLEEPAALAEYALARTAVESTVLISLAVLKVHNSAVVSLTCKNLIGITPSSAYGQPRLRLHEAGVQQVIADLVRLRTPDFAILDGIVGLEGDSPMYGTPVPMNLVVAGRDPVAVDAVGSAIMGIDPQTVDQLTLLAEKGVGQADLAGIDVKGSPVADVRRPFRRE